MIVSLWSWYFDQTDDGKVAVACARCNDPIGTYTPGAEGARWDLQDLTTAAVRHLADAHRPPLEQEEKKS